MPSERYNRQVILWGKANQEKLEKAKVIVIGSGPLAQYVLLNYAGLGIGHITVMDNERLTSRNSNDFLYRRRGGGNLKVRLLEDRIMEINPLISVDGIASAFEQGLLMEPYDIIVDVTNNSRSKMRTVSYAHKNSIPAILGAANTDIGAAVCYDPSVQTTEIKFDDLVLPEYNNQQQGNVTSGVIAGLVTDETRKRIFLVQQIPKRDERNSLIEGEYINISSDKPLPSGRKVHYDLSSLTGANGNCKMQPGNRRVLVVGAGALGNFVALNLSLNNCSFDIMDHDVVEETNLNRQPFFYDRVGKPKAAVLCERLKEITNVQIRPIVDKFGDGKTQKLRDTYALVIGCVDNIRTRYDLSIFSRRNKIPYIDGGVSEFGGQARIQLPYKTSCIVCQEGLEAKLRSERERLKSAVQHGCITANASIVVPHIITASMMTDYALRMGKSTSHSLFYNGLSSQRIYAREEKANVCQCYKEYTIIKNAFACT